MRELDAWHGSANGKPFDPNATMAALTKMVEPFAARTGLTLDAAYRVCLAEINRRAQAELDS